MISILFKPHLKGDFSYLRCVRDSLTHSVGWSVGWLVKLSSFGFHGRFLHYRPCPNAWLAFCISVTVHLHAARDMGSRVSGLVFFGQRPRRGQCPVEHRGTFVCSFVCPSVRASPPSPRLETQIPALRLRS